MSQEESMAEDSFEKARRSFFGNASAAPQPAAPPAELLTLQTEDPRNTLPPESDID